MRHAETLLGNVESRLVKISGEEANVSSPLSRPAFVGRGAEMVGLARALDNPPCLALVEGEAGIGKSRLLDRCLRSAPRGGKHVLVGTCPPYRNSYTLGPVVDAIREHTDSVKRLRLSPLAGALRSLLPEWVADLPPVPEPAEDPTAARHRVFRALAELLAAIEAEVVVLDDAHWADEATLEFLIFLASRRPPPVSLVLSYRPEDVPVDSLLPRVSTRLSPGASHVRLSVSPLDEEETAALVSSMLDGEHVSDKFATFLHDGTDGVPLALEESVRLMHDRVDIARRDDQWVRRQLVEIAVPRTVRDAVLERAHRLPMEAQQILAATAVLDACDEATLSAVAELGEADCTNGLIAALGCGLLVHDGRVGYRFRHVLAARAVYESLPAPQRGALHGRAGEHLERSSPQPVAALARHFREAGDMVRWAQYAERAADRAMEAADETAAAGFLHELLAHAALPPATVARLAMKLPFGSFAGEQSRDLIGVLRSALESQSLAADASGRQLQPPRSVQRG